MKKQHGFTLIETLAVLALVAILFTLGAFALRRFWQNRSLSGGANSVVVQLGSLAEKTRAESHPVVYGAAFEPGTSEYQLVSYQVPTPSTPADCISLRTESFDAGVVIEDASFVGAFDADEGDPDREHTGPTGVCRDALGSDHQFAFFFARGTATAGDITLRLPALDKCRIVTVNGLTGRVEEGPVSCS